VTDPRLDNVLQAAKSRVQGAVTSTVEKLSNQMSALTQAASSNLQRQVLMSADRELQRKSSQWLSGFGQLYQLELDKSLERGRGNSTDRPSLADTDWTALSLVDNAEVERGVTADRMAQGLNQACEAELDALQPYLNALDWEPAPEGHPLRPRAVAGALLNALSDLGCDDDVVQALSQHIARLLGPELAVCYKQITADLRARGLQPQGLSVVSRARAGNSQHGSVHGGMGANTLPASLSGDLGQRSTRPAALADTLGGLARNAVTAEAHLRAAQALSQMFGVSMPGTPLDGPAPIGLQAPRSAGALPAISPDFQNLLQQIAHQNALYDLAGVMPDAGGRPAAAGGTADAGVGLGLSGPLMAANLIRAHREELVRASGGAAIDQMVIDIVAALFDQVLSDPKVAPQMARQIARLQMPVLRVALGDMSFFNSRKHPVRRFVNRVATLSASFDDYTTGAGLACLERVTALVDDIVAGDFDRMEVYESKLAELETYIESESARDAAESAAVAALLSGKEADLRVQQRYMQLLRRELADVEMPDFVRDFLAQIWSQVQVMASARDGVGSPFAERMKKAGHDLVLSVQPKGHPQLRKAFLLQLPQLMKDLNEGLGLIQWSEEAKQGFFSQLLPAHAECLKAPPPHELTQRLLEKQLSKVEQIAIPSRADAANDPLPAEVSNIREAPVLTVVTALSPQEVQAAGFVAEAAVAAEAALDLNLDEPAGADPSLSDVDINLDVPPPPSAGPQLVQHIEKGTAYQMMMQGEWKKVRLTWVSEGRTFFIFTQGHTHKQTISLTARTLAKMCDSGRFKAFEQAELIERATMRARRQLAALGSGTRDRSAA